MDKQVALDKSRGPGGEYFGSCKNYLFVAIITILAALSGGVVGYLVALDGVQADQAEIVLEKNVVETAKTWEDPCVYSETEEELVECRKTTLDASDQALIDLREEITLSYETMDKDIPESTPKRAPLFRESQSTWLKFRDAECNLRTYDSWGGTAYDSYLSYCLTVLNYERIEDLKSIVDNP